MELLGARIVAAGEQRRLLSRKSAYFNALGVLASAKIAYMMATWRAKAGIGQNGELCRKDTGGRRRDHSSRQFQLDVQLFPVFWFSLGAAPLAMFFFIQFAAEVPFDELRFGWYSAITAAAAGSLILINHVIVLITTEIAVTTFRFVFKTGLVSRHTQEVSLNKIEEITLHQTVWGRLLSYGKLVLRGTGVGVITLPDLDDPIRLRRIIENAKSALRTDQRGHEDE